MPVAWLMSDLTFADFAIRLQYGAQREEWSGPRREVKGSYPHPQPQWKCYPDQLAVLENY
jgi:hypothetical protein